MFPFSCEGSHWNGQDVLRAVQCSPVRRAWKSVRAKGAGSVTAPPCLSHGGQSLSRGAAVSPWKVRPRTKTWRLFCIVVGCPFHQQDSAEEASMPLCLWDVSEPSSLPLPCKTQRYSLGSASGWVEGTTWAPQILLLLLWGKPEESWEGFCSRWLLNTGPASHG